MFVPNTPLSFYEILDQDSAQLSLSQGLCWVEWCPPTLLDLIPVFLELENVK